MLTSREEKALEALREAISAAHGLDRSDETWEHLNRRFRDRLLKVIRYGGKPPSGTSRWAVARRVQLQARSDREGT